MSIVPGKIFFLKCLLFTLTIFCAENVLAQPVADFSATPVSGCAPLLVNFIDLSTGNPTGWKWDLGNSTTATNQNPSATYFMPGQYKITLTVTNAAGSGTVAKDKYITVLPNPTVNFTAAPATGCLPLPVQFTDQSAAGSGTISTWKWDFGDGSVSSLQNPQHTYTSSTVSGTFDVTLQVKSNFGCSGAGSKSKFINTGNSVTANFSNNLQSSCKPPVSLNFQNLSKGPASIKYQWDFGDNTTSAQPSPQHTYTSAGNFKVTLIASSSGGECSSLIQKTIVIGTVTANFNSPPKVCQGIPFSLSSTSSPTPGNVHWDFGDGTTFDSLNPLKFYSAPGNYTIKLVADFGACQDSLSKPINVLSKQNIAFTSKDTAACKAPFTVNFTADVPGAIAYSWNFGDGSTSAEANPVHTYTVPGSFDVSLSATNSSGCQDTLKKLKYVKIQAPVITLPYLPLKNCVPFTYTFTSSVVLPDSVVKYSWDFGDGGTDSIKTPTHTFGVVGNYAITLSIITSSGCAATIKILNGVMVGNKPVAKFSAAPLTACANTPIIFTDLSTGNVNEWSWNFGDKNISAAKNPTHNYLDTGFFKVTLIARSSGCPDTISFNNYIYIKPPVSRITIKSLCTTPYQKTFIDSSKGADSWLWDFGDKSPLSTLRNPPVHTYPDTSNYFVSLKVTNASTGCVDSSKKIVQVISEKAAFTANDTSICRGSVTYLMSQNNATKIANYYWTFGDGTVSFTVPDSVFHRYLMPGYLTPKLFITDLLGCRDTLIKPLYINVHGPTARFSGLQSSCLNTAVTFIDSSVTDGVHPIVQWVWDYGDSSIETLHSPPFMHSYTKPGIYTVKLKVTDSTGCVDSLIKKNYLVISKPVADFTTMDTATCPQAAVQFTSLSQGVNLTYLWNFGDGATASDADPVHQYSIASLFTVGLKTTDRYGCTDSIKKMNYVAVTLPKANFTLNDSVSACPPFLVSFTNTSVNADTLSWDFGDGNFSSSANPTHFYFIPGTYIVKLRATGPGGCFDEKLHTIVVKGPKGVLSYSNITGCNTLTTNFKASATNNVSFTWDFEDGMTVKTSDSSITHLYANVGFYLPKLILEDENGCQVPILGIDTIKVIQVQANFSALSKMICDAGSVTFNDSTVSNDTESSWLWNFGDGATSTQQNPAHDYTASGTYDISQIVTTVNGCKDTAIKKGYLKIIARPDISIQGNTAVCEADTITFKGVFLTPDTSAVTWQWNFGDGNTSLLQYPPAQKFSPSGNYTVTAIATNSSGCKDTAVQPVVIHPLPAVDAGNDRFLCIGSTVQLQASGANTYQWLQPVNFLSCTNCFNPVSSTPDNIRYTVKGTNSFGCSGLDSINIKVKKPFKIMVTPARDSLCAGQSVQLNASLAENYLWVPATGLSSAVVQNPTASPGINVIYKLLAYDSANCFKDSAFVNISVFKYPVVNAGADKTITAGSSVLLSPVYSNDIASWLWIPAAGLNCDSCPAPVARPTISTTYTIKVTNYGGCSAMDDVTVFATCNNENIFIPNTFSPNGDGVNDVFYPRGKGLYKIRGMKIFNRWGQLVFERSNFYANDPSSGWDGSVAGKKVSPDVFTFIIDIICDNNDLVSQQGSITLIK